MAYSWVHHDVSTLKGKANKGKFMLNGLLVGSKFLSSFCVFFVKLIFILFFAFDNKGEIR